MLPELAGKIPRPGQRPQQLPQVRRMAIQRRLQRIGGEREIVAVPKMLPASHVTGGGVFVWFFNELACPVDGNALECTLRIPHVDVAHAGVGMGRADRDREQSPGFAGGGGGAAQAAAKGLNVADVMVGSDGYQGGIVGASGRVGGRHGDRRSGSLGGGLAQDLGWVEFGQFAGNGLGQFGAGNHHQPV